MDDGPTDGPPGKPLPRVSIQLSRNEAFELLKSLRAWAAEIGQGHLDQGWHTHIADTNGSELTISVNTP
jgi:hypothetical protein